MESSTFNFWNGSVSSSMARPAIWNPSVRHRENCSARGTRPLKLFHQHRMLLQHCKRVAYTRLEYGQPVNWHNSRHLLQKDTVGHCTKEASHGLRYRQHYQWPPKLVLNSSSAIFSLFQKSRGGITTSKAMEIGFLPRWH